MGVRLHLVVRTVLNVVFAAALIALGLATACGQAGAPPAMGTTYLPTMTFDVTSVRESKIDAIQGFMMSGMFLPHTTTLHVLNWTAEGILSYAYGIDQYQIVGAPHWPWPTLFVIEGKGDIEADAKMKSLTSEQQWAEQKHMFQALLADRFRLQAHWETKEGKVYNLVVAKGGLKLGASGSIPPSAEELKSYGSSPVPELRQKNDGSGYDFIGNRCTTSTLAGVLASQLGRPVGDRTGLTGRYDFVLKYEGRSDGDRKADDMNPTPPLDQAIQGQLGLKLEPGKGPVKVLVIDHMEKPTDN